MATLLLVRQLVSCSGLLHLGGCTFLFYTVASPSLFGKYWQVEALRPIWLVLVSKHCLLATLAGELPLVSLEF